MENEWQPSYEASASDDGLEALFRPEASRKILSSGFKKWTTDVD
jgi:hypothetical protein